MHNNQYIQNVFYVKQKHYIIHQNTSFSIYDAITNFKFCDNVELNNLCYIGIATFTILELMFLKLGKEANITSTAEKILFYGILPFFCTAMLGSVFIAVKEVYASKGRNGVYFNKHHFDAALDRSFCDGWNFGVVQGLPCYFAFCVGLTRSITPTILSTVLCTVIGFGIVSCVSICKDAIQSTYNHYIK